MTRFLKVGTSLSAFAVEPPTLALALFSGDLYEGQDATFRVTLSRPWVANVTVAYATSNGTATAETDYTSTSGTATLVAGTRTVDIVVPTTLRAGAQASRTFTLTLSNATDAAGDALTITTAAVQVTILDTQETPDLPTLSVASVGPADEGSPLTFRVTSSLPFVEDVTFSYATGNGSATAGTDYTSVSGLGTITAESLTTDIAVSTTERAGYQGARTVTMTISAAETASEETVTITQATALGTIAETETPTGDHAYFETLQADPAHYVSYSLRSQVEIDAYTNGTTPNEWVTYNPGADTDPQAQDAAKVVIPLISESSSTVTVSDISDSATVIQVNSTGIWASGRLVRMGSEYITLNSVNTAVSPRTFTVTRGVFGSAPQSHPSGTLLYAGTNSLIKQVRLPLRADKNKALSTGTEDGYTYLFTWDGLWTDSYLMPAGGFPHKCFQFSGKNDGAGLLWEPRVRYDQAPVRATDVARVDTRMYSGIGGPETYNPSLNLMGPGVTDEDPLGPQLGSLTIKPGVWVRWHVKLVQQASDYDLLSMWISDETTAPVQMYNNLKVDVRPNTTTGLDTLRLFWLEYNTSVDGLRRDTARDFVAYFRNFAALRWTNGAAPDVTTYLEQP